MTPERVQQIEELYHAVRDRTPEERAALLADTDPELRREIESLLAQRPGDFMDRPAIQNSLELLEDATVTAISVGLCLGPYRIETKLAEAGMGQSFRATDPPLLPPAPPNTT